MGGAYVTIYTKERPENSLLESYVQSRQEFQLEGRLGGPRLYGSRWSPVARLRRVSGAEEERLVNIYDIKKVFEDDDMPAEVAEIMPAPGWVLEVSHVHNDEQAWDDCMKLARYVAEHCKGICYTGEAGIEWPEQLRGVGLRRRTTREVVDVLSFEWFVFSPKMSEESVTAFLETLRELFPSAWPRRFGDEDPLQEALPRYEHRPFLDFWRDMTDSTDFLKWLWFKAEPPCLDGNLSFPMKSNREMDEGLASWESRELRQTENICTINLRIDGGAVSEDPAQLEGAIDLFKAVSARLGCFYARGYFEKRVGSDGIGEMGAYPHKVGHEWTGLPPMPMWLNWFGKPYKRLVMGSIKNFKPEERDDGVFVMLGPKPATLRQLEGLGFALPNELLPTRARTNSVAEEVVAVLKKLESDTSRWAPKQGVWSPPVWERGMAETIPNFD